VLATCALAAFAANSVLCRLALAANAIDPAGFTAVRLGSGAITLAMVAVLSGHARLAGSWGSAAALFSYAGAFSFAYTSLTAGTGALILFAAVQITMILGGWRAGERPRRAQWVGLALAFAGICFLLAPGLAAPAPGGAALMTCAGAAWGVYSLRGRRVADPLAATADNFLRALPVGVVLALLLLPRLHLSSRGVFWAALSGSLTSGLGYVAWYAAVRRLSSTRAAVIQLAVPVLAASGGVILLGEPLTSRLLLAGSVVLGGVALAVLARQHVRP
jgi:drug/metabolite transporter (DMT)-like permease